MSKDKKKKKHVDEKEDLSSSQVAPLVSVGAATRACFTGLLFREMRGKYGGDACENPC